MSDTSRFSQKIYVLFGLLALAILQIAMVIGFDGTYDSGDSIQHFQVARYAPQHPKLFLDHWGKPLFTLLAAPFAQFDFIGIKIFNCLMTSFAAWNLFRIARRLLPRFAVFAPLFLIAAPEVFQAQFSGLTEPLFAALLTLALAQLIHGKTRQALVLASLLPFVRTEGFLLLPVFAFFIAELAWNQWMTAERKNLRTSVLQLSKDLSLLCFGTLSYSLIGWASGKGFLWVFTQNPYETMSNYGIGDWGHFPEQMLYVVGLPIYALLGLGLALAVAALVQQLRSAGQKAGALAELVQHNAAWRLVNGIFFVYFCAHVVFWATGTAHSMGLLRVMIAICPMAALIGLRSFSFLNRLIPIHWLARTVSGLILAYILLFPLLPNPAALKNSDFILSPDQNLIKEAHALSLTYTPSKPGTVYTAHPYVCYQFGCDPWENRGWLTGLDQIDVPIGSFLVWDSWFGVVESGIQEQYWLEREKRFKNLKTFSAFDKGKEIKIKLMVAVQERRKD